MCHQTATTREHVPPAAFFPEVKDSPKGANYRINLITVPSCQEHNTGRSGDDQYVGIVIASTVQSNEVAQRLMTPKTLRALHHRPRIAGFFDRLTPVRVGTFETGAFLVDRSRFDRAADHYARGLFFNDFAQKLEAPLTIHTSGLLLASGPDPSAHNAQLREVTNIISVASRDAPRRGQNPDVFYYQIVRDSTTRAIIRMVFYEGFVVDAFCPDLAGNTVGDA